MHRQIHILCLVFDMNSLMASYRLVFFSDALHLSLGTSRTHHHCSLGRCHPHTVVLSHTRTHSSSLTHASVATNCSVLNHPIGSIIGSTLLLGLEIEKFKMRRLRWRREVLVNVRAAHGTNTTRASSAWCACSRVSCPSIDTTRPSLVSAPRLWLVIVESSID